MQLYADGWYMDRENAEDGLALCVRMGALPVGVVENEFGSWGYLYWSDKVLFDNHRIDGKNCLSAVRRAEAR